MKTLDRFQFDLLALAVVYAVCSHAPHLPLWLNLSMALVVAIRWVQRRRRPSLGGFPLWLRLPLTLALPVGVILTYGNLFGRDPGSALATGLLALKLCESEKPRDARSAVTFGSFLLMAALLFDQSLLGSLLVGLGLLPQIATLRALQREDDMPAEQRRLRHEFAGAASALALSVPLALASFLFLPRLASPLWGAPTQDQGRTGVGDDMRPGSLTELLIDDSPAFRVTFDAATPPSAQRYWRGKVLWNFDGAVWTGFTSRPAGKTSEFMQVKPGTTLSYDVTLDPTLQNKLFVLDMPLAAPVDTQLTTDMTVWREKPVTSLFTYHVDSALDYKLESALTPRRRREALSLPEGFNPRTKALAEQWRAAAQNDGDVVRSALTLFNKSFSYTLNAPPLGRDGMDDFLFNTRAGFCEHFSSAFTVLMRAAGIPARVVIGYQGGYWNELGNYLVVRQSDAHAWSEIWLEGRGWVRVDPTGAVSPQRVQLGAQHANGASKPWYGSEWLVGMRNEWDVVNRFWNDAIVRFDTLRQGGLLKPFGVAKADTRELGIALLISGCLFIGAALWWTLRQGRHPGDALDRAWARLGSVLAKRGLARAASEGPQHYAQRALAMWPQAKTSLAPLFDTYLDLRYARAEASPADVQRFSRSVREFQRRGATSLQARPKRNLRPRS